VSPRVYIGSTIVWLLSDLYEQCACELYPEDRALCKKRGDKK